MKFANPERVGEPRNLSVSRKTRHQVYFQPVLATKLQEESIQLSINISELVRKIVGAYYDAKEQD